MASPNVFREYLKPPASDLDYLDQMAITRQRGAQSDYLQHQLGAGAYDLQQKQETARQNALERAAYAAAVGAGGTEADLIERLKRSGHMGLGKIAGERERAGVTAAKDRAMTAEHSAKAETEALKAKAARRLAAYEELEALQTPEQARQSLMQSGLPPQVVEPLIAQIKDDPAEFEGWKAKMFAMRVSAEKRAEMQAAEQGRQVQAETTRRGQDLTDARIKAEGAANRAVSMRGQNMTDARAAASTAETGPTAVPPALGLPRPAVLPWANQTNARDANKVKAKEIERGGKEVEKDEEAARQAAQFAADAKRFLELNASTSSGGTSRLGVVRAVRGAVSSDASEMEGITARLAPAMRQPGSGATSDYDAKMFERGTVGLDKPKATNDAIAAGIIARAELAQSYALFRQSYLEQNGTLQGADRYWKSYVNANPIFDPTSTTPKINPNRKPWQEHFSGGQAQPAAPTATPGRVVDFSSLK